MGSKPLAEFVGRARFDSEPLAKAIHRLVMTSSTYRQSSRVTPEAAKLDPGNALLSRMPLTRVDAETLRDSILLIAGRLESGMMKLEQSPIDLIPVLEESINSLRPIASKRNITIELSAPKQTQKVIGDRSGLQQVFVNLINNAVKFSPKDSVVDVHLSRDASLTRVSISDHGLGIPPESIQHLFKRFYRAQNVTLAEIPGSGIGLYIVKSIVEELGGSINVESVQNKGTTFSVSLQNAESKET